MSQEPLFVVRDNAGATYGPANIATLQQWIGEGRITAQMQVAPQGTQDFVPASVMPALAAAFAGAAALAHTPAPAAAGSMTTAPITYSPTPTRNSTLALTSLICGIGAWIICPPCSLVAIVTGHMARGKIRREPDLYEGQGLATVGLLLGYIHLALALVVIVIYVLMAILFVAAASTSK